MVKAMYNIQFVELISMIALIGTFISSLLILFNLWYRFGKLERQAAHRQEDIEVLFNSIRGCLEAAVENGANGSVKAALGDLNEYITKKASGQQSKK
jgi:hypothetical protein